MKEKIYHITSLLKIVLGCIILLITYTSIDVYEDTAIAISLAFLSIFIITRGASFFLFLLGQKVLHTLKSENEMIKDSYKLSLLFGIFCIINVLLLILGKRNKFIGLILLIIFILMQIFLFEKKDGKTIN